VSSTSYKDFTLFGINFTLFDKNLKLTWSLKLKWNNPYQMQLMLNFFENLSKFVIYCQTLWCIFFYCVILKLENKHSMVANLFFQIASQYFRDFFIF